MNTDDDNAVFVSEDNDYVDNYTDDDGNNNTDDNYDYNNK